MKFKIFNFKKVKSTNDTAIRLIKNSNFKYGLVVSEIQTNGRGQYGKRWISYKENLFISFFLIIENFKISLKKMTKINCLLIKKFLSIYCKKNIVFKKPNDLLIEKKKICGILQESITKFDRKYLIIGIGINLNKNPKIKNYPTTNLRNFTKKRLVKKKIIKELKNIFEENLNKFYKYKRKVT